jgi:hypothetical protein
VFLPLTRKSRLLCSRRFFADGGPGRRTREPRHERGGGGCRSGQSGGASKNNLPSRPPLAGSGPLRWALALGWATKTPARTKATPPERRRAATGMPRGASLLAANNPRRDNKGTTQLVKLPPSAKSNPAVTNPFFFEFRTAGRCWCLRHRLIGTA